MANNKVVFGNETLIDLTEDTATEETVLQGYTFHSADGVARTGTAIAGGGDDKMDIDGSNADSAVTFADSAFTVGSRASSYDIGEFSNWEDISHEKEKTPYAFWEGAAVVYNDKVHIFSGSGGINKHYSWDGSTWKEESTLPFNLYYSSCYGSAVVYNNKIHIFSGYQSLNNHYSWDGTSWTQESTLPYGFYNGSAVVYNDEIHILGGGNTSTYTNHYAWDGTQWKSKTTFPYAYNNFVYGGAVVYENRIHAFGSSNSSYSTKHYSWGVGDTSWTQESGLYYQFYEGAAAVYNNKIHFVGSKIGSDYSKWHVAWDGTYYEVILTHSGERKKASYISTYGCYGSSLVVYHNKLYIFGGNTYNTGSGYQTVRYQVLMFDDLISDWILVNSMMPYNISTYPILVEYNDKLHILGGYDNNTLKKHMSWDGFGYQWRSESILPYGVKEGSAVVYNNKIHILGSSNATVLHISWNEGDSSWTVETNVPYNCSRGIAVIYNNKIHILGGSSSNMGSKHYSWDGTSWTQEADVPFSTFSRETGTAAVYQNKIYIFYDNNGGKYSYYDGTNWSTPSAAPIYGSSGSNFFAYTSAVVCNNVLYIIGINKYYSSSYTLYNICYSWNGAQWKQISSIPKLYESSSSPGFSNKNHSAVVYKNNIYFSWSEYIIRLNLYNGIVEVENSHKKTITQGDQLIAEGDYSYARGSNCSAIGDYSKIEGIDGLVLNDLSTVYSGSGDKFLEIFENNSGQFCLGFSVCNNCIRTSNTVDTPLNGTMGLSGTAFPGINVYVSLAPFAMYVIFSSAVNNSGVGMSIYIIATNSYNSTANVIYPTSGTPQVVVSSEGGLIIRIASPSNYSGAQFTLIRLA